jgi:hypothetical protein
VCPNFEDGACNAPITDCNGIVACLTCVDQAAVDQAIALYYGSPPADEFGTTLYGSPSRAFLVRPPGLLDPVPATNSSTDLRLVNPAPRRRCERGSTTPRSRRHRGCRRRR